MSKIKLKTINITEKEYKLLLMILEESEDDRSDMGCNDPYDDEKALFTKEERNEMEKIVRISDGEDENYKPEGFMFNVDYVTYLKLKIESQK